MNKKEKKFTDNFELNRIFLNHKFEKFLTSPKDFLVEIFI